MIEPAALLKDLVRINTTNPPGEEEKLLLYLERILQEHGIPYVYQESAKGRGNLLAWQLADQAEEAPLILMSHTDVVAAQASQWKFPPFEAQEVDGYIYGRGTVDTKQLTAMELTAFLALKEKEIPLKRDVYFLATSDEESGSAYGLQWFLDHEITVGETTKTGRELFRGSDVISEGGGFPVVGGKREFYLCESGQKSCGTVEFTVKAKSAKGAFFTSGDGMERAMGLAEDIGKQKLDGRVLDTVKQFEQKLAGVQLSPMMQKILTAMKQNSMTVTMITGKNVNEVTLVCDVRLLPGFGQKYLQEVLKNLAEKWDCSYRIVSLSQGYESSPDGEMLKILEEATLEILGKTKEEAEILPFVSMGSSDGRFLAGGRHSGSPVCR